MCGGACNPALVQRPEGILGVLTSPCSFKTGPPPAPGAWLGPTCPAACLPLPYLALAITGVSGVCSMPGFLCDSLWIRTLNSHGKLLPTDPSPLYVFLLYNFVHPSPCWEARGHLMGVSLLSTMVFKDETQVRRFDGRGLLAQPLFIYFYVMTQSIFLLSLWLGLSVHHGLPFSLPARTEV